MSAFYREKVLSVRHWTDTLFSFTATRDGVAHSFMVGREALEDVEYQELTTNDALLEAFGRQQELIAMCAGKALDSGATGKSVVELQSLLT